MLDSFQHSWSLSSLTSFVVMKAPSPNVVATPRAATSKTVNRRSNLEFTFASSSETSLRRHREAQNHMQPRAMVAGVKSLPGFVRKLLDKVCASAHQKQRKSPVALLNYLLLRERLTSRDKTDELLRHCSARRHLGCDVTGPRIVFPESSCRLDFLDNGHFWLITF